MYRDIDEDESEWDDPQWIAETEDRASSDALALEEAENEQAAAEAA